MFKKERISCGHDDSATTILKRRIVALHDTKFRTLIHIRDKSDIQVINQRQLYQHTENCHLYSTTFIHSCGKIEMLICMCNIIMCFLDVIEPM